MKGVSQPHVNREKKFDSDSGITPLSCSGIGGGYFLEKGLKRANPRFSEYIPFCSTAGSLFRLAPFSDDDSESILSCGPSHSRIAVELPQLLVSCHEKVTAHEYIFLCFLFFFIIFFLYI